ncbi:MAG: ParA family protein [Blastocatellia bacterium]
MKIFAIANQKGGVGKTTTTVNLASALASKGNRVLVIDLDSQACASAWLTGEQAEQGKGIHAVLANRADITLHITKTNFGLDLVKSNVAMAKIDIDLQDAVHRDHRLEKALAKIKDNYDYVLLDCPPSLGLAAINAFIAADKIIVPVDCRIESYQAIPRLLETTQEVASELEREYQLFALPTFLERTKLSQEIIEALKSEFPGHLLPSVRKNTRLAEAFGARQPIFSYDRLASGAIDYSAVAEELCHAS